MSVLAKKRINDKIIILYDKNIRLKKELQAEEEFEKVFPGLKEKDYQRKLLK
jgi:hypothetical protein